MGAHTGAEGNSMGTRRVSPRCVVTVGAVSGYYGPNLSRDVYRNLVIGDL
jgi:hypothetical protein